jgi:hypothetical protein
LARSKVYLFPLLAFAPMLLWREWIKNFPTGIPVSDWLFNGTAFVVNQLGFVGYL